MIVVKQDGRREEFSLEKLERSLRRACGGAPWSACERALVRVLSELEGRSEVHTLEIRDRVARALVEESLAHPELLEAAKRYELAKIYNDAYGKGGWSGFDERDLQLSFNALKILEARYLIKNTATWRYAETPQQMFKRVARAIAETEKKYGASEEETRETSNKFYELMSTLRFLPNSPTLMNAGTRLGILSACFVIPVRDSMTTPDEEGIMDALRAQAIIHQQGGGTGFDFSEIRPENDIVESSGGLASGPLSFMRLFDVATDVVKQGGKRRGANMGVMHVWHPDIEKFIVSKTGELKDVNLQNFNISVGFYDYFFEAVERGEKVPLVNPRKTDLTGEKDSRFYAIARARHYMSEEWVQEVILEELEEHGGSIALDESIIVTIDEALAIAESEGAVARWVDARELLEKIVRGAWDSGDPGFLNIDEINRRHPVWYLGKINATNPCGEVPLLPWEACNLGSINLEKYVVEDESGEPTIDWEGLARDVATAVRFLDNVIDANRVPLPRIKEMIVRTRRIGLGVMGLARMLIRLGVAYDSVDAVFLSWSIAEFIAYHALRASVELARERGPFPAWDPERYRFIVETLPFSFREMMNIVYAETRRREYALEPSERAKRIAAARGRLDWERLVEEARRSGVRNAALLSIAPTGSISIIAGTSASIEPLFALAFLRRIAVGEFIEVDPLFLEELRRLEIDEPEVLLDIAETGSVQEKKYIPRRLRRIYKTAHDIAPEWHLLHQAAWQAWVDNGVSKTVNLRHDASVDVVRLVYMLAWRLHLKGTTVYRDRSKSVQVINIGVKRESGKRAESTSKGTASTARADSVATRRPHTGSEAGNGNGRTTRRTIERATMRLGRGKIREVIAVAADYAGGCPTCDI